MDQGDAILDESGAFILKVTRIHDIPLVTGMKTETFLT
jgi:hypothetical protein